VPGKFLELLAGRDFGSGPGARSLELGLDERILGAMMRTGSIAFTKTRECADETEVELGLLGEGASKGYRVESLEELVELSGGDRAPGILNVGAGFDFQDVEGGFAGVTESLVLHVLGVPALVAVLVPSADVFGGNMNACLSESLGYSGVTHTIQKHEADLIAVFLREAGYRAVATAGGGRFIAFRCRWVE